MTFDRLIRQMTNSIVEGDGSRAASYFAEDGFYHDVFYGVFKNPRFQILLKTIFTRMLKISNGKFVKHPAMDILVSPDISSAMTVKCRSL